ncbi:MAG: extracellular solute-binding protein [Lachnospiraceae bacterium]|nr:extracellular solute-binding protein [Lachnospiraceae bacterium]
MLCCVFLTILLAACGKTAESGAAQKTMPTPIPLKEDGIVDFSFFGAMQGLYINEGNEIQEIIAQKTGVRLKESWLGDEEELDAIRGIIASGKYPDLIDGGDGSAILYEEGALIPWDEYLESGDYPNLSSYYTEAEWDQFRQPDGHIYWCNVFQKTKGESTATIHNDEAFWVQARVLAWANYPTIETLDEYFNLLERYVRANPLVECAGGEMKAPIAYTCLCDGWRYFCIENAPQFLDGYPNDGTVIVDYRTDPRHPMIVDYNTTDTARRYLAKLNEEYKKGFVDPEFATQSSDEYIAKLSDGSVLGMCDQYWAFQDINDVLKQNGLDEKGCNYVPLGLTIDKGMDNRWHTYGDTLNVSSGVAVTTACSDPDLAFSFLNAMLDQEIHDLRFWGVKGIDYLVDEEGIYYRTDEMRSKVSDPSYKRNHLCMYEYLPQYGGTSDDGKNANFPSEQPSEFMNSLAKPLAECFAAYGAESYPDMIGSVHEKNKPWFPMWSYSNTIGTSTAGGIAWTKMGETKHLWLPILVMSKDFDSDWEAYMADYEACQPQDFLDEMQAELDRRARRRR